MKVAYYGEGRIALAAPCRLPLRPRPSVLAGTSNSLLATLLRLVAGRRG